LRLSYLSPIFSGRLHECDAYISFYQHALSLLPRSAPTRASDVYGLATARLRRYQLSKQQDDLRHSILGFTEAILSPPLPLLFININQAFRSLTVAICLRAAQSKHPEDVKYSVIYLRYCRGLLDNDQHPFSLPLTSFLVRALSLQAELKLGDVDQDIEEMADLCEELLDSDISTDSLTSPIIGFAKTVDDYGQKSLRVKIICEKVIACLRRAIIPRSDSDFQTLKISRSQRPRTPGYSSLSNLHPRAITIWDTAWA